MRTVSCQSVGRLVWYALLRSRLVRSVLRLCQYETSAAKLIIIIIITVACLKGRHTVASIVCASTSHHSVRAFTELRCMACLRYSVHSCCWCVDFVASLSLWHTPTFRYIHACDALLRPAVIPSVLHLCLLEPPVYKLVHIDVVGCVKGHRNVA